METWFAKIIDLIDYIEIYGQIPMSPKENPNIYYWIKMQQQLRIFGDLDTNQIALLNQIPGWEWIRESDRIPIYSSGNSNPINSEDLLMDYVTQLQTFADLPSNDFYDALEFSKKLMCPKPPIYFDRVLIENIYKNQAPTSEAQAPGDNYISCDWHYDCMDSFDNHGIFSFL